ncbi:MAG: DNA-binding response regulator [Candidatus Thermofonsia Clade 1 bacterium]|uniref:DNA-binding response regulator n=1 Tax=Candidatus Thermofonsia Clade 1 bacterium TaxID=2364210 RepID=A0A2M8PFF5_9CHLR|nr:MAG: DNA-binding response regulator [Candidatus Thermofonsia Clade 1 bacterium]
MHKNLIFGIMMREIRKGDKHMAHYILAVDDESDVLGTLERALKREGYQFGRALSAQEAMQKISARRPDLLILDISMPDMDGLKLCKQLRADPRYADLLILFLTAHVQTEEIIAGLDAGGDDYVTKPFELTELNARVRALLRRVQHLKGAQSVIELGNVRLDSTTYQVHINGKVVQLTATEHRLLRYLMEHPNQPFSPSHLLEAVWDYPAQTGDPDLVRAHIRNLRAKLGGEADASRFIRTIFGVGYMVSPSS